MDYFQREVPVSATTPVGTHLPDYNVSNLPGVTQGSAVFQGIVNGQAQIQLTTTNGFLTMMDDPAHILVKSNTTSYRDLREVYTLVNKYAAHMEEQAAQSRTRARITELSIQARDARRFAGQIKDFGEQAAVDGHFPLETYRAYQYVDKMAAEQSKIFQYAATNQILTEFRDNPQEFARELIKPHRAGVLKNIQQSVDSIPDVTTPHTGMNLATLDALNARPSAYRPDLTKRTWQTKIQPQIQAEFLAQSLERQSGKAFEDALSQGPLMAGRSQADIHPDNTVVLNAKKFVDSLEGDFLLDPQTRRAMFGSEQHYQRWLTLAKTLENFDKKNSTIRAGIGSFMAVSRQSAGITMMGYSGLQAAQGKDPNVPLFLFGGALLMSPIVLAKFVSDPKHFKDLILGLKQTPQNFMKTHIAAALSAATVDYVQGERDKHYPVLPGEPPTSQAQ
jgi:hypothetical protein